jgi:hypothetical protein
VIAASSIAWWLFKTDVKYFETGSTTMGRWPSRRSPRASAMVFI